MNTIVFSDLDGTLLDSDTYSFAPALDVLAALQAEGVPLVLSSSKTRAEVEIYHRRLALRAPFIVENGGAVVFPKSARAWLGQRLRDSVACGAYRILKLGLPAAGRAAALREIRAATRIPLRLMAEMSVEEVAERTGLNLEEARLAQMREHGAPFVLPQSDAAAVEVVAAELVARGLSYTRGNRFHYAMGNSDKGQALRLVRELYAARVGSVRTLALGDSLNDLPLLREADCAVLVRKREGTYDPDVDLPSLLRTELPGPAGWAAAIRQLIPEVDRIVARRHQEGTPPERRP